jgi:hypothetical protein
MAPNRRFYFFNSATNVSRRPNDFNVAVATDEKYAANGGLLRHQADSQWSD